MKYIYPVSALVTALFVSAFSFANAPLNKQQAPASVEAIGRVFYKMPSGEIVDRDVTLVVPFRGQGQVKLLYSRGEAVADSFSTLKENDRTIFLVKFSRVPYAPPGTEMEFKGTYTRGTNKALYYGDIFASGEANRNLVYTGGFFFKADVK